MPRAKSKADRVRGEIAPERLYSIEASEKICGLSRAERLQAKKAGVINVICSGRMGFIKGSEIIAWVTRSK